LIFITLCSSFGIDIEDVCLIFKFGPNKGKGCTDLLTVEMLCFYCAVCIVVNDAEGVK